NVADLGWRGALGGQACSFHFDAGTQLHDLNDFTYRRQMIEIDTEGPTRILGNKGSDTLTGYHQPLGAQRGHRFAHDGSADAGRRTQPLPVWWPRARWIFPAGNMGSELWDELMCERPRRRQRPGNRQFLGCLCST